MSVSRSEHLRHPVAKLGEVARRPHTGDHVLALGVGQEVARRCLGTRHLVAAEGHARARRLALVAIHHLLHIDGRAPVIGQTVDPAVLNGAVAHPGVEHGADRLRQLLLRVGGEVVVGLEALGQLAQGIGVELDVEGDFALALHARYLVLEALARDPPHHVSEHLHQPSVAVPGEAFIAGARGQAGGRLVVQAEIQDRVHHPRHRLARA